MRSRTRNVLASGMVIAGLAFAPLTNAQLFEGERSHGASKAQMLASEVVDRLSTQVDPHECDDEAGEVMIEGNRFECQGVDVRSFIPNEQIFAYPDPDTASTVTGGTSDVWGWTSPDSGDEYAIVGASTGAAVFRVTDADSTALPGTEAAYLGHVLNTGGQLIWFDIKVNNDHAYIVSESAAMGMKIIDLTQLDGMEPVEPGTTVPIPAVTYPVDLTAHNVVINEDSDTLYLVGSSNDGVGVFLAGDLAGTGGNSSVPCQALGTANGDTLDNNGLFAFDISDPTLPVPLGCHTAEGYVHDANCVTYRGGDVDADGEPHAGKEICLSAHEEGVSVVDMSDPTAPVTLSDTTDEDYPGASYSHQGWLSEDQAFYFHGDEGDEGSSKPTRTFVFDVRDLDDIALHFINEPGGKNIDHNMYTHDGLLFQSNYTTGLQVFDTAFVNEPVLDENGDVIANGTLPQLAEFDVFPDDDFREAVGIEEAEFAGTWSNYPYFASGVIPVTATEDGIWFLSLDPEVRSAARE